MSLKIHLRNGTCHYDEERRHNAQTLQIERKFHQNVISFILHTMLLTLFHSINAILPFGHNSQYIEWYLLIFINTFKSLKKSQIEFLYMYVSHTQPRLSLSLSRTTESPRSLYLDARSVRRLQLPYVWGACVDNYWYTCNSMVFYKTYIAISFPPHKH